MIRRSELTIIGDKSLGAGGFAEIWRCTHDGVPRVFKEYKPELLAKIDRDTLRFIVSWPQKLPLADQATLRRICAWPESLVTSATGELVGLLMPQAPAEFFQVRGTETKPRHASRLAIRKETAVKSQLPYFDFPHKLARLGNLLTSLQFLHSNGVLVGDLQWRNVLVASPLQRTSTRREDMFLVDCDSFVVAGRQAVSHNDPEQWRLPYPINEFSETTDLFKFALMSIRCLAEQVTLERMDYTKYFGLLPKADFIALDALLNSPNPGLSSADLSAMARAWQASVNRSGQQFRRRDGVVRELWTEPMRKAHLAGLPGAAATKAVQAPKPVAPLDDLSQLILPDLARPKTHTSAPPSTPARSRTNTPPAKPAAPAADTSPDAKSHLLGVFLGTVAVACCAAAYVFFIAPDDSDHDGTGGSATTTTTTPASVSPLRSAKAGDCIHMEFGEAQPDGVKRVTVTPATCGTAYATDRITAIVTDGAQCSNHRWVRASGAPVIFACLVAP